MAQHSPSFSALSPLLQEQARRHWQRLLDLAPDHGALPEPTRQTLLTLFGLSDFVADSLIKQPELLGPLLASGDLDQAERWPAYEGDLAALLVGVTDEEALKRILRQFRRSRMLVIAWRELLGHAAVEESFIHLTKLADALICGARDWLYAKQCDELGTPVDGNGDPQPLLILGMGKLGGGELNFSSDIDLIFTFPENGYTVGGRRELANQQFFIKLGQRLINALHQSTVDGQVFRVDMRLRPFGDAGPLAISFAAMEDYYQHHGRNWERYAMVKARVLGPQCEHAQALTELLRPFVFRRYIDFGVIDGLRQMKAMIAAEVRRKGLEGNIKLGAGGIREVEFIAQALQLIRGGREPALRVRHLPEAIAAIARCGALEGDQCERLLVAYRFLRRVENILQEIGDQQTQTLPTEERDRQRLIASLGFDDWAAFMAHLDEEMAAVHREFVAVVGEEKEAPAHLEQLWLDLWRTELDAAELAHLLAAQVVDPAPLCAALLRFKEEYKRRQVGPQGRIALDWLMPELLRLVVASREPARLFERVCTLLTRIFTRSAYLQLLAENPAALRQLVRLCDESNLVSEQLARYPILLDELLDPQHLYHSTPLDQYKPQLRQFLLRIPEEDVEQQMEALRQFKQVQLLRIVAADIAGALPLMKVSDHLTWLAEAITEEVVNQAWAQMSERYGVPPEVALSGQRGFAVVAYGKLGGIELGYGSDLDLVFLHGGDPNGQTDGRKPIDSRQFYLRLAQRILHLFSTRTPSGILYEIDMRLRPSGDSGLLVSSLSAYEQYQQNEAWTWEHQALVRARPIYGDDAVVADFARIRRDVLAKERDLPTLAREVREMRQKMRDHLLKAGEGEFDLKQSPGGMVDIEFIAQYLVLAHACGEPEALTRWSDNVRIFDECVMAGVLTLEQAEGLKHAYLEIRNLGHRLNLSEISRKVGDDQLPQERGHVLAVWQQLLGE
ncbi:bifunctional [glutamate--ammonia ligase]-adenylyl-L-tyrosine phosphorylase/[glutamate--ammonia-ligase] adenylyltransferase [Aeromonas sanarellii]|uniref:bifunctional [glutamate--ammonia ligase]-adenylyl-L-tyrosine phosphorylase/[glutamate--ammonia-ligase] adenylyltransferase n=1 Tax=Aeromonas sanarellii TaxID=633415 RepID=UPI002DB5B99F|nr:bifunctional [glutamate--ammonia ligase]-adenylyl-L-tyrosine phosphorylase/[glutamate--ammonia-ligase] adenylyltransferase [Aeromonas sanarellii]MEB6607001.1 bifunctional [glutamate--ammonia ligase]-adenylyl-L-tyrosine phosphorylase/[glutamate--ammonia-ligase] adenylyltransferase [Aeromonas sanarellii]